MTNLQIPAQPSTVQTPEWVRDAVFYQIFPDRFAFSATLPKPRHLQAWDAPPDFHSYKGGDLIGVAERLDYLVDLGINAIYFNPIFWSASVHRYHTYDYLRVDPLLGGNEAFRTMLDAAHARGIRVVLDGVFNHASRGFFQFHDIMENGKYSPFIDWFRVNGFPVNAYDEDETPNYEAWWNLHALPKFNVSNPEVREFLLRVGEYWVSQGIDGWRLDVPSEIKDDSFWQEFRRRVKQINPDAYIVGEVWEDARHWLQGDQFDAVMNYLCTRLCIEFFIGSNMDPAMVQGTSLWPARPIDAAEFGRGVDSLLKLYPPNVTAVQLNLLDSHDTARFITMARGDEAALRLALLFLMVYPGAPCVYYGDEVGMTGGRDPFSRPGFPWDPSRWNQDLLAYYKRVIALRHAYPALRRGEYYTLYANGNVYALGRHLLGSKLVAVFNVGREPAQAAIPISGFLPDNVVLTDVLDGTGSQVAVNGTLTLPLAPRSAMVFSGS